MVVMDLFRSRLESEAIRRDDCLVVQADERFGLEVTVFREWFLLSRLELRLSIWQECKFHP
jgi:hypothetical protein